MATAMQNGNVRRPRYPPPPPAACSLAERERAVLATLADVAAIQLEALPARSLVRRLVEPLLHELDCWATDPLQRAGAWLRRRAAPEPPASGLV